MSLTFWPEYTTEIWEEGEAPKVGKSTNPEGI